MFPIIEIEELKKAYKGAVRPALNGVSLSIQRGEKFGIFGPNGAGKTTLISILCGIVGADSGIVRFHWNGQERSNKEMLSTIGFVPQDFAFYPELTATQNLQFFGKMHGIPNSVLAEKIDELLRLLGLDYVKHKKLQTFSGGMKRRINLAIGIIHDPGILFLDEPTVGVDVQSKVAIVQLLESLCAKGTTIIYTSHHLKEAEDFCDRIALIDHGQIIGLGALQTLVSNHNVHNLEELLLTLTGNQLRD